MAHWTLDDVEQGHIFTCLEAGKEKYLKLQRDAAKLGRVDPWTDGQLALNASLRQQFNPHAEEEARAESRKDEQIDMEEQLASSGETGGMTRLHIEGPGVMEPVAMQAALESLGIVVSVADNIENWTTDERYAVQVWMGQLTAHNAGGLRADEVGEEPECLASVAMSMTAFNAFLEAGPFTVSTFDDGYAVVDVDDVRKDSEYTLRFDADVRAAQLNKASAAIADLSDDDLEKWLAAGPFATVARTDGYWDVKAPGSAPETVSTELEAWGRAARYNRTIGLRAVSAAWEQAPVRVSADDVQVIEAAVEAGELHEPPTLGFAADGGSDDDDDEAGDWMTEPPRFDDSNDDASEP